LRPEGVIPGSVPKPERIGEPRNIEAGGVRREDRPVGSRRVQIGEDVLLDRLLFDRGLGHDIGVGDCLFEVGRRLDPVKRRVGFSLLDYPAIDGLAVAPLDVLAYGPELVGVDVTDRHPVARERADRGDTPSHLSGPDDRRPLDVVDSHGVAITSECVDDKGSNWTERYRDWHRDRDRHRAALGSNPAFEIGRR
jgi:hypothetical protein